MNHDIWDTPEERELLQEKQRFQAETSALHTQLRLESCSLFAVGELKDLLEMPRAPYGGGYSKEERARLEILVLKVERKKD